jgi:DNA-directed RNA polymerase specialized sigma24 family protein
MAEDGALERLTPAYREALLLEAEGATPDEMAARLDIPVESIPSLLRLAHAKAARGTRSDTPPGGR